MPGRFVQVQHVYRLVVPGSSQTSDVFSPRHEVSTSLVCELPGVMPTLYSTASRIRHDPSVMCQRLVWRCDANVLITASVFYHTIFTIIQRDDATGMGELCLAPGIVCNMPQHAKQQSSSGVPLCPTCRCISWASLSYDPGEADIGGGTKPPAPWRSNPPLDIDDAVDQGRRRSTLGGETDSEV